MIATIYRFNDTLGKNKLLAIRGVRTATKMDLKKAKDLVEAADHNGVVLSFTQAYAINAGLNEVELAKMLDGPDYKMTNLPRLIEADKPLDLSEGRF